MKVDLSPEEIENLLESLKYSKKHISDARDTPYEVRREKLRQMEKAEQTLRDAKAGTTNLC
jgi:hypothetical protein